MKTWHDVGIDVKGHNSGEIKTLCPKCSSSRKKKNYPCLNVNIDKGVFNCWHCAWSGSLKQGEYSRPMAKFYRKPDYVAQVVSVPEQVEAWFESRGITKETLRRNQIAAGKAYFPQVEEERGCVLFPYLRGTEVINIKYRTRDKLFRMEGGCERVLYGLNDIGERLVWVEGEIDKLSVEEAGIKSCVSVPDGAPTPDTKSYESKFDFLGAEEIGRAKVHIIAVDNDPPGERLREELVRRLGAENCLVVNWTDGCKDANDVLVKHGAAEVSDCIDAARPLPIDGAFSVEDFAEELNTLYRDGTPRGVSTGWENIDQLYTVRPGEITVITGIPNSGKSEWLDALTVNLARQNGWMFAMFSAENWPVPEHIKKLAEKYMGKPFDVGPTERMTSSEFDMARTWLAQRYYFIAPEDPTLDMILDVARQLVLRYGVRGLVIDPWNEIEHARPEGVSETEHIGRSLSRIRRFGRAHGCHVWVVAHPTKLFKDKEGNYPVPTPYDISGSANWRNKADNCITVWRDLAKATITQDTVIYVQKVRNKIVGRLGDATLKYSRVVGQYREPPRAVADYRAAKDGE